MCFNPLRRDDINVVLFIMKINVHVGVHVSLLHEGCSRRGAQYEWSTKRFHIVAYMFFIQSFHTIHQ